MEQTPIPMWHTNCTKQFTVVIFLLAWDSQRGGFLFAYFLAFLEKIASSRFRPVAHHHMASNSPDDVQIPLLSQFQNASHRHCQDNKQHQDARQTNQESIANKSNHHEGWAKSRLWSRLCPGRLAQPLQQPEHSHRIQWSIESEHHHTKGQRSSGSPAGSWGHVLFILQSQDPET